MRHETRDRRQACKNVTIILEVSVRMISPVRKSLNFSRECIMQKYDCLDAAHLFKWDVLVCSKGGVGCVL